MKAIPKENPAALRLWQAARYMPRSVRLLGTRYRSLFLAYAELTSSTGAAAAVADAMAFVDFMFRQDRLGLLGPEKDALQADLKALKRRFRLLREGQTVTAKEKWKVLQWLGL